jgi:hypothetical protein
MEQTTILLKKKNILYNIRYTIMKLNNITFMNKIKNERTTHSAELMINVLLMTLIYQSFDRVLNLNFSFSKILIVVSLLSIVIIPLSAFNIKANTALISLFFMTLIIGVLNVFSPLESSKLLYKPFYAVFLSLTFLITINNLSDRKLDRAIVYNSSLAMFCIGSEMLKYFGFTVPIRFYDYIPVYFLVLNLVIYAGRFKSKTVNTPYCNNK